MIDLGRSKYCGGLSVKDVADYASGLGPNLAQGTITSLGDNIIEKAFEVLHPDLVKNMKTEDLHQLKKAVGACDLSLEQLRQQFCLSQCHFLTLLQLPLIEVGNAARAYCYSIASSP